MINRPRLGVFSISGCAGCVLTFLSKNLIPTLENFETVAFPIIKENNEGKLDIAFVEGTVVSSEDITVLNEIRKRTKTLVALGSCACFGGVPSIKNFLNKTKIENFVYPRTSHLKSVKPTPLNTHVKVDYHLPQCPPNKQEIREFLICYLNKRKFELPTSSVCVECRQKGNTCLLEEGKLCLGPITAAGCDALCPSKGVECYGCRGPAKDSNIKEFVKEIKERGFDEKMIKRRATFFAGLSFEKKWKKR